MADVESYERRQNKLGGRKGQPDAGDIADRPERPAGHRENFRGPSESKSGLGVSPKASGSPWSYGRSSQAEANYGADYSRKGSGSGSNVRGPRKPSDSIPDSLFSGAKQPGKGSRGQQKEDHV